MSGICVEGKFGQHLNACEDSLFNSNKRMVLNKKTADLPSNGNLFDTLGIWMQRSQQRKHLAQLDKHLLDDIGLTDEMVAKEVAKPFWK